MSLDPTHKAVDIDGSAVGRVHTEDESIKPLATLRGITLVKLSSEDGSSSLEDEVNNALNVQEIAPSLDRYATVEVQAATTITAAETAIGGEINVAQYDTIAFFADFTLGDETSFDLIPKFLRVAGGDEHAFGEWSSGATRTFTAAKFRLTASAKVYIVLDVTGIPIVKIYGDATGGTPTGTVQLGYTKSNNA